MSGLSYDANGNMASMPGIGAMAYDGRNRWQGVAPGQVATRGYDPSNRRIWRTDGYGEILVDFYLPTGEKLGTYRTFLHNGHGQDGSNGAEPCYLPTNGGKLCVGFQKETEYFYFGGRLVKQEAGIWNPASTWYQPDRLGSHAAHHPYGEPRGANWSETPGFATYWREPNGIDYAQQRYYSSTYGRFLTPDPYRASAAMTNPQSWNRYVYVEGDPVNFVDPEGLFSCAADSAFSVHVCAQMIGVFGRGGGGGGSTPSWVASLEVPPDFEFRLALNNGLQISTGAEDRRALEYEALLERAVSCISDAVRKRYGLTAAGVAATLLGPIPKSFVPPYRVIGSDFSTLLSGLGHFIQIQIPRVVFGGLATQNLLRAAGRVIAPVAGPVGWALLAVDAALITADSIDCYQNPESTNRP